ncbi:MAG: DUF3862 domain-containing protein [Methylococcales bacterium]|nr:DUF3862 domain-containing protein [Methylococcales bacterium]
MLRFRKVIVSVFFLLLVACGKVNQENFNQLKTGMEYKDVVALLGKPDSCDAFLSAKNCIWGETPKKIEIKFVSDVVLLFSAEGLES